MVPAARPTSNETRAPYTSWENTSSPLPVVPNQLDELGPWYGVKDVEVGECGAISGAKTATSTNMAISTIPTRAFLLLHSVRRPRPRKSSGTGTERSGRPPPGSVATSGARGGSASVGRGCDERMLMTRPPGGSADRAARRAGRR